MAIRIKTVIALALVAGGSNPIHAHTQACPTNACGESSQTDAGIAGFVNVVASFSGIGTRIGGSAGAVALATKSRSLLCGETTPATDSMFVFFDISSGEFATASAGGAGFPLATASASSFGTGSSIMLTQATDENNVIYFNVFNAESCPPNCQGGDRGGRSGQARAEATAASTLTSNDAGMINYNMTISIDAGRMFQRSCLTIPGDPVQFINSSCPGVSVGEQHLEWNIFGLISAGGINIPVFGSIKIDESIPARDFAGSFTGAASPFFSDWIEAAPDQASECSPSSPEFYRYSNRIFASRTLLSINVGAGETVSLQLAAGPSIDSASRDVNLDGKTDWEDRILAGKTASLTVASAVAWKSLDTNSDSTISSSEWTNWLRGWATAACASPLGTGIITDYNGDEANNLDDISDFITDYYATPQTLATDFNGDFTVNLDDLSDFTTAFYGLPASCLPADLCAANLLFMCD
jgi:hypothetical protein